MFKFVKGSKTLKNMVQRQNFIFSTFWDSHVVEWDPETTSKYFYCLFTYILTEWLRKSRVSIKDEQLINIIIGFLFTHFFNQFLPLCYLWLYEKQPRLFQLIQIYNTFLRSHLKHYVFRVKNTFWYVLTLFGSQKW